jgi:hypothetical protein
MICRIPVSLLLSIPTNLVDVEKYSAPLCATVMAEYTRVPGDAFPPIKLDRLGRLNDGFRRLTAAVMRGEETILCEVVMLGNMDGVDILDRLPRISQPV